MTVNYEIKGMLAKLLATEDIIIEHKKVDTASFNVHTRVLTLPMWNASNVVVDLLCAHEVGHARETPNYDWSKTYKIPQQFLNVTEDARVEKLMKRRYAGLSKTFYHGYKELHEQDFFSIEDVDVSTYNLADRVNLYFKIGNFINVEFNQEEQDIVDEISNAETFEDALIAAEKLYNYCKNNLNETRNTDIETLETHATGSAGMQSSEMSDQTEEDNDANKMQNSSNTIESDNSDNIAPSAGNVENDQPSSNKSNSNSNSLLGGKNKEPEVSTNKSLESALKNLTNNSVSETVYVELPDIDVSKIIIPNKKIHELCKTHWDGIEDEQIDNEFLKFKKSAQSEVSYLVKEFECRKSADSYQRSSVSTTGVLDCSKLHSYKFNDDLFKKITTVADGKNHGLIFILDWSGSMQEVMMDTVKQLFNLIWFCKKVSIPFEVYAFTNDYPYVTYDSNRKAIFRELPYTPKEGLLAIDNSFSLMNIFTSKVRSSTLEEQMKNIFRISRYFSGHGNFYSPPGMSLSGTPLDETIIALHKIIPLFQKENKVQKVQCVILTDGESCGIKYHKEVQRKWENEPYMGAKGVNSGVVLRNRKTGNTYTFNHLNSFNPTKVLLKNLRDSLPETNIIGIRILDTYYASSFIREHCGWTGGEYERLMSIWKKDRAFSIKTSGYNSYFGISSNALSQNSNFSVTDNATKTQIKTAFMKSLNTKKMNKKILNEFISLIA